MNIGERLQLLFRAWKYRYKNDKGGIAYLLSSIRSGETVLDIGAHKGGYLYYMQKQVGKEGQVFAFEPQSRLFNYLGGIKQEMAWSQVHLHHLALSDQPGTFTLYIPSNKKSKATSPGASLLRSVIKDSELSEEVRTQTLDAFCQEKNIVPNLIKLDVEGNELKVFEGGRAILEKHKPRILVECEARHVGKEQVLATFDYLIKMGYSGRFIRDDKRLPLSDFRFEEHQEPGSKPYCNNFIFEAR